MTNEELGITLRRIESAMDRIEAARSRLDDKAHNPSESAVTLEEWQAMQSRHNELRKATREALGKIESLMEYCQRH